MSDRSKDPKVIGTPARATVQTTRPTDAPGVLGTITRTDPAPADGSKTLDDGRVIATSSAPTADVPGEMYTPKADVTETDQHGSVILIAAGGVPIPIAEARRLGILKDRITSGPEETKD